MVNNGCIEGINKITGKAKFCEPCILAKSKKLPFKHKGQQATHLFQVVHSDVGGPINIADCHGNRYWISFINDYGHFPWVYFMWKKSKASLCFWEFRRDIQTHLGAEIHELHLSENFVSFFQSDNRGEYIGKDLQEELQKMGIVHLMIAPDTPEQNGLAEHMNQTLVNMVTAILIESGLPTSF